MIITPLIHSIGYAVFRYVLLMSATFYNFAYVNQQDELWKKSNHQCYGFWL